MPGRKHLLLGLLFLLGAGAALGQDVQIHGRVTDESGAVIVRAVVRVLDQQTGIEMRTATNSSGQYVVAGLTPSEYKVFVEAPGFNAAVSDAITLNVAQDAALDFSLKVGSPMTEVVVNGSGANINTSDASVSTVVDRQFVEGIPLNGRSFQTLLLLAPGVVTATPQGSDDGEFSVNGQRTNSNYYMVDGVSANNAAGNESGVSSAGMAHSASALGTTHSMLPADALQEFRISTSSYAPDLGRQPGAQISMQSRSGTNQYRGELYDYLRNTVFDANSWFNKYTIPALPRSTEQQNDLGGVVGGPLSIPRLFSGRDRAFFFAAYEGLRVNLPIGATIFYVPSNGTYNTGTYSNAEFMNVRANAPDVLKPALNAYPLPNCTVAQNPHCLDYGDGLSPYIFSGTSPSRINTYFLRLDLQANPRNHLFVRYNDSPSDSITYSANAANTVETETRTRVFLLGADSVIRGSLSNEIRLQYSPASLVTSSHPYAWDGAVPFDLNAAQGLAPGGEQLVLLEDTTNGPVGRYYTERFGSMQFQPNAVDNVSWARGAQVFKAGADYRQTTTYLEDGSIARAPAASYIYTSPTQMVNNNPHEAEFYNAQRQDPTTRNLGIYFMDQWRVHPRLTLNLGLRWDLNPPPSISGAQMYTYTGDVHQPETLGLSRLGAPLYQTALTDLQPRAGVAWEIRNGAGRELVLRAGGGLFFDTVSLDSAIGSDYGNGASNRVIMGSAEAAGPHGFPFTAAEILEPFPPVVPPYLFTYIADPHVRPPSSAHWNASLEQGLGGRQSLTIGYVGSTGMRLINWREYHPDNPDFTSITQFENGPGSSYNALQVHLRRHVSHGIEVMSSYVWSHAIDSDSTDDAWLPVQRGNSSHDVRNNLSSALVYATPRFFEDRLADYLTSHWTLSLILIARSAFPVEQSGADIADPTTGDYSPSRLNYDGRNPYAHVGGVPGGRQFDPSVFTVPATGLYGAGDAPRNFLRGFGEFTSDVAVERHLPLFEGLNLRLRAEAFNITNHPNFGTLNLNCGVSTAGATCNNTLFGQANNQLSDAMNGVASIYQQGGPRSLQVAMKFEF